jgi:hypothetical protein
VIFRKTIVEISSLEEGPRLRGFRVRLEPVFRGTRGMWDCRGRFHRDLKGRKVRKGCLVESRDSRDR